MVSAKQATYLPLARSGIESRSTVAGGTAVLCILLVSTAEASVFFPVGYDNTANTVTTGPTPNNNQTIGNYRDVWWASINNGQPRVGSPDYINYGKNLVQVGNHAEDNGTGLFDALNFTGPTVNGRQSYLTIFDTTPADGTATKDTFALGTPQNHLQIVADVLFAGPGHSVSAGILAMYNDGNDGLALLAHNGGGNNPDHSFVSIVYQNLVSATLGNNLTLATVNLANAAFAPGNWYQIVMDLWEDPSGTFNVEGRFYHHTDGNPANNLLLEVVNSAISFNGSLANPSANDPPANFLSNPGQIGLIAQGREAIGPGAVAPGTPLPGGQSSNGDNVGVSFYLRQPPPAGR